MTTSSYKPRQNITRFDHERTHGWWVRFERGGEHIRRLFSDKTYGGKKKALSAAQQFRDSLFSLLPPTKKLVPLPGRVFREKQRRRRASGEYIHHEFWSARIQVAPGTFVRTRFSLARYGSKQAKEMANSWLAARQLEQQENYELLGSAS